MPRYFLTVTVDEPDLIQGIKALRRFDAEIKLRPADAIKPPETIGEIVHGLHSAPAQRATRAKRGNGGEWPAPGSLYMVILKALETGPKGSEELREALRAAKFSGGSLNSALGRLEKGGKVTKDEQGAWAAA
jgi:hypothetical protein